MLIAALLIGILIGIGISGAIHYERENGEDMNREQKVALARFVGVLAGLIVKAWPIWLVLAIMVALTGCKLDPAENGYTHGLTLYDKSGCAFNADAPGSWVSLQFNRMESGPDCKFKPE